MRIFRSTIKPKLAFFASRFSRRIWSRENWMVFAFDLTLWERESGLESTLAGDVKLTLMHIGDLEDICAVYPYEFRWAMTDAEVRHMIEARLQRNIPAFVARARDGSVLGAVWCYDFRQSQLRDLSLGPEIRWFEMVNGFVVPAARGRSIYGVLDSMARATMKKNGYNLALSQVRIDRYPMIKASLRLGYRLFGVRTMVSRFGKRTWHTVMHIPN